MKNKKLLAIILLSLSFCFVISGVGYGEIIQPEKPSISWYMNEYPEDTQMGTDLWRYDCDLTLPSMLDFQLLWAMLRYVMRNPTSFEDVSILYDSTGRLEESFPKGVNTKEKICIAIQDVRGYFSDRSGIALKEAFKGYLDAVYSFIKQWATDMNTDIVVRFISSGGIPLGYFYQGEYHLWEE
ncbi:hypothetical protein ES702_05272 [subsurface metagenome]